mmetsp:Transcript_7463/g.13519  ORF Transcript_7463/g.13519 Transcript_7463/m.13519 type:complete len:94 (+) Transcript_7463:1748-2029(+)
MTPRTTDSEDQYEEWACRDEANSDILSYRVSGRHMSIGLGASSKVSWAESSRANWNSISVSCLFSRFDVCGRLTSLEGCFVSNGPTLHATGSF